MEKHCIRCSGDLTVIVAKPLAEGRFELLYYLKEQSISFEYHRYGSITEEQIE